MIGRLGEDQPCRVCCRLTGGASDRVPAASPCALRAAAPPEEAGRADRRCAVTGRATYECVQAVRAWDSTPVRVSEVQLDYTGLVRSPRMARTHCRVFKRLTNR